MVLLLRFNTNARFCVKLYNSVQPSTAKPCLSIKRSTEEITRRACNRKPLRYDFYR